ncbi:hypothetical protein Goshw_025351 [Gossypium schwendimanii]|uniref:Cornichon family protein n=1 Tax=Gossypium schwendimanii TaxID=34291 RepID=A0A7J9NDG1_GOSSC|nr:hypothetical protein [Gossypium schwendimanii]
MVDLFIWLFSFFILVALLIILVYQVIVLFIYIENWKGKFNRLIILLQLICLADLEFDYINPYDSSSRINKVVLPEFILEGFLCFFYLLTGHWVMSLLCAPYLYYNVRL